MIVRAVLAWCALIVMLCVGCPPAWARRTCPIVEGGRHVFLPCDQVELRYGAPHYLGGPPAPYYVRKGSG